jgi:hypothetical protein
MSVAYRQAAENFAVAKSTPRILTDNETDKYFVYSKADWHRSQVELRAAGTPAKAGGFNITASSFTALKYSIAKLITDEELQDFDAPQDPEGEAVEYVTDQMLLHEEKKFSSDLLTTGVWNTDLTGTTNFVKWDAAGSTPVEDIEGQKTAIQKATGKEPNKLYLGKEVWDVLKHHAELVDRLLPSNASDRRITRQMLAALLELDEVVVSAAIENTAAEGATATNSYVVGKVALLAYVNTNRPRIREPSAFYTFAQKGLYGAEQNGSRIFSFYNEDLEATKVVGNTKFVHKVVGADLATFFTSVIA